MSGHLPMAALKRAAMRFPIALGVSLTAGLLAACGTTSRSVRPEALRAIDSIPADWREEPVVALRDSVEIRLLPSGGKGNRVGRRQVQWLHVNRRNPALLQDIVISDFQSIEAVPKIHVKAWFPDGSTWSSNALSIPRFRWTAGNFHSSDQNISTVRLPRYVEGMTVRVEVDRTYFRPEFLKSEIFRGEHPCLSKTVSLSLPEGAGIRHGFLNPERLALDSAKASAGGARTVSATARRLAKLDVRGMPSVPEQWYAALHFSLPPKGESSLTWSGIGDYYLAAIRDAFETTPDLERLSAGLPREHADSSVRRVYNILRGRIRYHADHGILHTFVPRKADVVLAKGYGDCKEMSTLMTQLLRIKGVKGIGVALVSTPGALQVHGDFPSLGGFNHMIVFAEAADGSVRFYDPTVKHGDPADSYLDLVDRTALLLREGRSSLVTVPHGDAFRNRIATNSSVRKTASGWHLAGSIRLEGQCAFHLLPALKGAVGEEVAPLLKSWLKELFALQATEARLVSSGDRAIEVAYEAPFNAHYLSMDKGGLLLSTPSLFGGETRYTALHLEGPRRLRKFEQEDTWLVPAGFVELEQHALEHAFGRGAWAREGNRLTRTYAVQPVLVPAAQREQLSEYHRLQNRFQKATVWQR